MKVVFKLIYSIIHPQQQSKRKKSNFQATTVIGWLPLIPGKIKTQICDKLVNNSCVHAGNLLTNKSIDSLAFYVTVSQLQWLLWSSFIFVKKFFVLNQWNKTDRIRKLKDPVMKNSSCENLINRSFCRELYLFIDLIIRYFGRHKTSLNKFGQ